MSAADDAHQSAALPAMLINGVRQPSCPARPAEMLLQQQPGPYTTALAREEFRMEAWPRHTGRLAQAVLRLRQKSSNSFSSLMASHQVSSFLMQIHREV